MAGKQSAGLLVYRGTGVDTEVLLVHPGGPLWGKKPTWTIPKGNPNEGEELQTAAFREFQEETGVMPPEGQLVDLGSAKQASGKTNYIWAVQGDVDITKFVSNTFTMEWPPKSGQMQEFPENNKAAWFRLHDGLPPVLANQMVFVERLAQQLGVQIVLHKPDTPEQQSLL